jgi:RecB family exonuclease
MHTSYSALDTYKTCPLKYKFQAIDKIPAPKRVEAIFGSIIHSSLKFMFKRDPLYPTVDEVVDFFSKKWNEKSSSIEWPNPDKKADKGEPSPRGEAGRNVREEIEKLFFEEGIKTLKNFYKKNQPWKFNTVDLESRFHLEIKDEKTGTTHTLAGIIDRIDKNIKTDEYEIIDYKTAKRMPPAESLENDLQLSLYHMALSKRWPDFPNEKIKLSLYFLKHNEKITASPPSGKLKEKTEKTKNQLLEIIREIEERTRKNDFPPVPGPLCNWCGYKKMCPMWAHEYKEQNPPAGGEEKISEAIKEFFQIKETEEKNKKRLAELRADILAYMQQNNLSRVFGSPGFITKNTQERFSYDMEKTIKILKKTGYLEKILSTDQKKLEALLPALPEKLQEQILSLRTKKEFNVLKPTKKV